MMWLIKKNIDPNKIKIDQKSYRIILIYYIGYVTVKNYNCVKVNSVNPLYVIDKIKKESMEINIWY